MWVKAQDGALVNLDQCITVSVEQRGSGARQWYLTAMATTVQGDYGRDYGSHIRHTLGSYETRAQAEIALAELETQMYLYEIESAARLREVDGGA